MPFLANLATRAPGGRRDLKLGADANDTHERAHWQATHFAAPMSNSLPSSPIRTFQDYRRLRSDSGNGYSSGLHGGFNLGPNAADVGARPTQYAMTSLSAKIGRNFSGDTGAGSGGLVWLIPQNLGYGDLLAVCFQVRSYLIT